MYTKLLATITAVSIVGYCSYFIYTSIEDRHVQELCKGSARTWLLGAYNTQFSGNSVAWAKSIPTSYWNTQAESAYTSKIQECVADSFPDISGD